MSDSVSLAVIGVILALVNGVVVVSVGAWADGKKKRAEAELEAQRQAAAAKAQAEGKGHDELSKVREEYRQQIQDLRGEVRELRERLDAKEQENRALSITVARQELRITDLEEELARTTKRNR